MNKQRIAGEILVCIYNAFENLVSATQWACSPGCPVCCTDRVLLTSLEMKFLADYAEKSGCSSALDGLRKMAVNPEARPATTPNHLALMCINDQEPPAETLPNVSAGACPFLSEQGVCSVYPMRPLACRMMLSSCKCSPGEQARVDEWTVTLGLVFSQLVEQASAGGTYGLMGDVHSHLCGEKRPLLFCENLPGIPALPKHQRRLEHTLREIMAIRAKGGMPLGYWLGELRC